MLQRSGTNCSRAEVSITFALPTVLFSFYCCLQLPVAASSLLSLYVLQRGAALRPAPAGFHCLDPLLSKPYVDGGDELVPLLMLLSLAFAAPAASIMLVEGIISFLQTTSNSQRKFNCNVFLRRTVHFVGVHVFGLCLTALITDIIQLVTGSHSPFFLTVCRPNYTLAGGACDTNAYITKDICSGHDQHAIMAARKSFPSQHATLSAFAAVYVSMYFNATLSDVSKLLKPLLVFLFSISAALIGLTQITQHRSHPIDVYAGFFIGAFIAVYLALHAVANFEWSEDAAVADPLPPLKDDPLRALTERGHDSIYHKGPASASESQDELPAVVQTEEPTSARGSMGKDTMLTFSNSLPRTSILVSEDPDKGGPPAEPQLKALDPLVSEWRLRSLQLREKQEGTRNPTTPPGGGGAIPILPPGGGRAVPTLRPPQVEDAGPPPISPKSAVTRAKWLAIREKSSANQPRLLQVVALSKQQGLKKREWAEPNTTHTHASVRPNLNNTFFFSGRLSPCSSEDTPISFSPQLQAPPTSPSPLADPSLHAQCQETVTKRRTGSIRDGDFQNKSLF
uniref:Phospholipid phosphatase-related protein type 3 n=1 Tax=Gouania willdenowi TaxID=441366 RepID=A0A8C5D3R4_GOUWI